MRSISVLFILVVFSSFAQAQGGLVFQDSSTGITNVSDNKLDGSLDIQIDGDAAKRLYEKLSQSPNITKYDVGNPEGKKTGEMIIKDHLQCSNNPMAYGIYFCKLRLSKDGSLENQGSH